MKEAINAKIIILVSILTAMLLSCSPDEKELREQEQLKTELAQTRRNYDSIEKNMTASLNEIDKRISLVRSQKGFITYTSQSDVRNKKQEILNNIAVMDELLVDNEKRIEKLRDELKRIGSDHKGLNKRILKYERENKDITDQLTGLKQDLMLEREKNDKLAVEVEKLNIETSNQAVMYDNLHTQFTKAEQDAYVAYVKKGSRKDLKNANVIEKKSLRTLIAPDAINSDVKPDNFEKIDTRTALQIPIEAKDAKIVTAHDANSYKWCDSEDGKKCLCIVDPQTFWEKSKYLVIETK